MTLAHLAAAVTPSPTPSTTGTPGTPAVDGAGYSGAVTMTAGVVLVLLLFWLVQKRSGSGGVALLAFTAGTLLAATQIGGTFAQFGSTAVNSGVQAITEVLS